MKLKLALFLILPLNVLNALKIDREVPPCDGSEACLCRTGTGHDNHLYQRPNRLAYPSGPGEEGDESLERAGTRPPGGSSPSLKALSHGDGVAALARPSIPEEDDLPGGPGQILSKGRPQPTRSTNHKELYPIQLSSEFVATQTRAQYPFLPPPTISSPISRLPQKKTLLPPPQLPVSRGPCYNVPHCPFRLASTKTVSVARSPILVPTLPLPVLPTPSVESFSANPEPLEISSSSFATTTPVHSRGRSSLVVATPIPHRSVIEEQVFLNAGHSVDISVPAEQLIQHDIEESRESYEAPVLRVGFEPQQDAFVPPTVTSTGTQIMEPAQTPSTSTISPQSTVVPAGFPGYPGRRPHDSDAIVITETRVLTEILRQASTRIHTTIYYVTPR